MTPIVHHFGMVVPATIESYLQASIWELDGPIVVDPLQAARLCLVRPIGGEGKAIVELIEPLGDESPTYRSARNSPGWHHVGLELPSVEAAEDFLRKTRMLPVTEWKPAVLFGGRRVKFVYTRNRELVELVADQGPR